MTVDRAVLLGARNAFLVMLVGLLTVGVYQLVTAGTVTWPVAITWVLGVVVFYGSKVYYDRRPPAS